MVDMTGSSPAVADLIRSYQQTLVVAQGPTGWRPVGQWCRERGQGAQVLTAWNPGFIRPTLTENLSANAALVSSLVRLAADSDGRGVPPEIWPADGRAVGTRGATKTSRFDESGLSEPGFSEPGFCVWGLPSEDVIALAEEFGQFAIYTFDAQGRRRLQPCRDLVQLLAGFNGSLIGEEPGVEPLYLIAVIKPKDDQRERAARALADLQSATRDEPGCELYDLVTQDTKEPDGLTWLMIEKWSSREHWDAHMASAHVAAMGQLEGELMREPTELRFYGQLS